MFQVGLTLTLLTTSIAVAAANPKPQSVATSDFRGRLYLPAATPNPVAIVFLGGSEGHLYTADEIAPQLAALGYPVLGIDYHDGFDPGRKLDLIPIETFTRAVAWLRAALPRPSAIVVLGDSRGSEAALLTAIYDPSVAGVLALVPSSALWGATDNDKINHNAAWSWRGIPTACANCNTTDSFATILDRLPATDPARLPVERIHGPVFLAGSDDDAVWPSARMAREIAARLAEQHFAYPVTLLTFPHSSHQLLGPGPRDPISRYEYNGKTYTMNAGGTAAGTEEARNKTWAGLLQYLATIPGPRLPSPQRVELVSKPARRPR